MPRMISEQEKQAGRRARTLTRKLQRIEQALPQVNEAKRALVLAATGKSIEQIIALGHDEAARLRRVR